MAIIGELIKRGIELSHTIKSDPDPVTAQKEVLTGLLQKARDTAFGRAHDFKGILAKIDLHEAFASHVPYYDYDRIYNEWWKDVYAGKENITWPGKPGYFALSSGTTSNTKYIPVTDDMLTSIRNAGVRQVLGLAEFDLPAPFFQKEVLMLGSSTNLKEVNGHLEGEISGISAYNLPFWFKGFYRPGPEISAIEDWDERVEQIASKAPEWDIGGISGIPSWIELMLKRVMEHNKAGNIHELWPNLQVYTSGGVAFDPYRKSFDEIFGRPVIIVDTYLASEGYLATQVRPGTDAMALMTNNGIFFEFVPLDPDNIREDGTLSEKARALTIDQVEEEKDYIVIISTVAGAWRYMIGDTIKFTDLEKAEIKITGRTKSFLNVVGSQLSEFQMIRAIEQLEAKHGLDIPEFTVSAVKNGGDYGHRWYLGCREMKPLDEKEMARQLDGILQENNKNYKVARTKALKRVEVNLVSASLFYDWAEATRKKGGQTKVPKVMREEQFSEWEEFLRS
jgi:hypothetical protein